MEWGYFQKKFTAFNGRNFQRPWSAAVASAKPQITPPVTSQENHTADFSVPMKRPHKHTKPTNQPLQPRNHRLVTRYGNTADIGCPHGRKTWQTCEPQAEPKSPHHYTNNRQVCIMYRGLRNLQEAPHNSQEAPHYSTYPRCALLLVTGNSRGIWARRGYFQ
jgi:hypothetical protein